jgi:hypothetical protein
MRPLVCVVDNHKNRQKRRRKESKKIQEKEYKKYLIILHCGRETHLNKLTGCFFFMGGGRKAKQVRNSKQQQKKKVGKNLPASKIFSAFCSLIPLTARSCLRGEKAIASTV